MGKKTLPKISQQVPSLNLNPQPVATSVSKTSLSLSSHPPALPLLPFFTGITASSLVSLPLLIMSSPQLFLFTVSQVILLKHKSNLVSLVLKNCKYFPLSTVALPDWAPSLFSSLIIFLAHSLYLLCYSLNFSQTYMNLFSHSFAHPFPSLKPCLVKFLFTRKPFIHST